MSPQQTAVLEEWLKNRTTNADHSGFPQVFVAHPHEVREFVTKLVEMENQRVAQGL